ncbi:MAG TPA: tRNA uridine-5-carboxymethylaminomethyl(34) synthesis GTPase MnmE [Prolixibacteraceae bacterium]|nr:tRNA uridine-5-carboxymethylaminomethyl(34) synthesis GTPase MnmE [Prolixibacteraceae bacterium]
MLDQSTICAISTPPGIGGIAVIRLSGKEAISIADKIFESPTNGKRLADQKANTLHFGAIKSGDELIDEVVVSLFKAPHSFTGEEIVEISCHGSVYIQQMILQLLISTGARMARPGEFTQRAFLNGKMDLSQAEAVADLIASGNAAAHKLAISQMRGGFSHEIHQLRAELLRFAALVELELDFSEEDVEFADRRALIELSTRIGTLLKKLTESFRLGNVIKNGIPVAIIGETNVGKSTLLNALLNEDKAIVSDIHGTTRDVIEDVVNIGGTLFRFSDTAGIRETTDVIESMGIERSYNQLDKAEIVLLVTDISGSVRPILDRIVKIREKIADQQLIIIANKVDIASIESQNQLSKFPLLPNEALVFIAAKSRTNLEKLIQFMKQAVDFDSIGPEEIIVSNVRHYEALSLAYGAIGKVIEGLKTGISGDFLAQDIRECLHYLGEITGEVSTDEILGHIFKHFCIGK